MQIQTTRFSVNLVSSKLKTNLVDVQHSKTFWRANRSSHCGPYSRIHLLDSFWSNLGTVRSEGEIDSCQDPTGRDSTQLLDHREDHRQVRFKKCAAHFLLALSAENYLTAMRHKEFVFEGIKTTDAGSATFIATYKSDCLFLKTPLPQQLSHLASESVTTPIRLYSEFSKPFRFTLPVCLMRPLLLAVTGHLANGASAKALFQLTYHPLCVLVWCLSFA